MQRAQSHGVSNRAARFDLSLTGLALAAALDKLAAPAFVLSPAGRIVELNAAGRALLAEQPTPTLEALARAASGNDEAGAHCVSLGHSSGRRGWLVLLDSPPGASDLASRVERLARHTSLTAQQTRVLAALAEGLSNRGIAASLEVSVRTVEAHLCAVFDKLGVSSRAAVLATLLERR